MEAKKILILFLFAICISCTKDEDIVPDNNEPQLIASDLQFAEGPAFYNGRLYFSDIQANTIYAWNETTGLQTFKENSGAANGLYFDNLGNLVVCEGANKRITLIDNNQSTTILADKFENKTFNEPNDLWIAPNGNIYFTDPLFSGTLTQPGEYVYCILSSNKQIIKVVVDLVKPNGIVGNADGTILYIADYGASKIYQYTIATDGTLFNKKIFAGIQADGLTSDSDGNIYAASNSIMIYNYEAELINSIDITGTLTNLFYAVTDNTELLFATTHSNVYQIEL